MAAPQLPPLVTSLGWSSFSYDPPCHQHPCAEPAYAPDPLDPSFSASTLLYLVSASDPCRDVEPSREVRTDATPETPHTPQPSNPLRLPPSYALGPNFRPDTDNFPNLKNASSIPRLASYSTSVDPTTGRTAPLSRRPSISSTLSASTFASQLPPSTSRHPVDGIHKTKVVRGREGLQSPVSKQSEPPPSAAVSPTFRPPSPLPTGIELRSSVRSHLTASTVQHSTVITTQRSSIVTKNSSVTSLHLWDDEPSLEDVMGMYETGFHDDEKEPANGDQEKQLEMSPEADFDPYDRQHLDDETETPRPPTVRSDPANLSGHSPHPTTTHHDAALHVSVPHIPPSPSFLIGPHKWLVRDSASIFNHAIHTSLLSHTDTTPPSSSRQQVRVDGSTLAAPRPNDADVSVDSRAMKTQNSQAGVPEIPRDRYGFKKENQYINRAQYDAWNKEYSEYLARRQKKWVVYLRESGLMTDSPNRFPLRSSKTKRFIRKGIPPDWRGAAWFYYAGGPALLAQNTGVYEQLLQENAKDVDVDAIERDLHRTFPDNIRFNPVARGRPDEAYRVNNDRSQVHLSTPSPAAPGVVQAPEEASIISSLRRVLLAFAIRHPKIGYCQSLNFLAGLLLVFVESEEQTFWLLNIITQDFLPGTHNQSLEGSRVDLGVLMSSLRDALPAVFAKVAGELDVANARSHTGTGASSTSTVQPAWKLKNSLPRAFGRRQQRQPRRLPPITMCLTAWFMSCYIGTLPMETTLRVWDILFYEGPKTLFRVALAVFKLGEREIEAVTDPMEMFSVVQTLPRRFLDPNALVQACFRSRNGFTHLTRDPALARREERERVAAFDPDESGTQPRQKAIILGWPARRRAASTPVVKS